MTCNVVLVSGVWQSESVIHIHISILFPHIGCYKLLNRFPWRVLLIICFIQWYVYVIPILLIIPPLLPTPAMVFPMVTLRLVLKSVLYLILR